MPDSSPSTPGTALTSKQRAHLRGLAHTVRALVHVGKEGVTTAALRSLRQAFQTRELVKVRVLDAAPETAQATGAALAGGVDGCHVVQTVGRTVTLYRADPKAPEIRLPKPEARP